MFSMGQTIVYVAVEHSLAKEWFCFIPYILYFYISFIFQHLFVFAAREGEIDGEEKRSSLVSSLSLMTNS